MKEAMLKNVLEFFENYFDSKMPKSEAVFIARMKAYQHAKEFKPISVSLVEVLSNHIYPTLDLGAENSPIKRYWQQYMHPDVRQVLNILKDLYTDPMRLEIQYLMSI